MKRGIYHCTLALLLALLPALPSCKAQTELEETSLTVSTTTLSFASTASEQSISVQTSAESWSYLSPQEFTWFTLEQSGAQLKVKVKANTEARERTGVIAISSGGQQRRVLVKQAAAEATLTAELKRIELPQEGGTRTILLTSNGEAIKAELATASNWLSILEVSPTKLVLQANPNSEQAARSAKINLSLGKSLRELEVVQQGTLSYYLPLEIYPAPLHQILNYERARGSVLASVATDQQQGRTVYHFLSTNPQIASIDYSFQTKHQHSYYTATITSQHPELYKGNAAFASYLSAQGFTKQGEKKQDNILIEVYSKDKSSYVLQVVYTPTAVTLTFQYLSTQRQSYATFKTLPMQLQLTRLGNRKMNILGTARSEIATYEGGLQSTLDKNLGVATYDRYYVKQSIDGEFVRGYFFYAAGGDIPAGDPHIDHITAVQGLYEEKSLGFYLDDFGEYHLTQEFTKLLSDAGYQYQYRLKGGQQFFYNSSKKTALFASITTLDGVKYILQIQAALL